MTILDTIKAQKLKEVEALKLNFNVSDLEKFPLFSSTTNSLKNAVKNALSGGIIAEFKRKSPAKGNINLEANIAEVTQGYVDAGAVGLSVLTDELFFGAKKDDFHLARKNNTIPILRKDFILDEHQIFQSKAIGADVILLIAKFLTKNQLRSFTYLAHELGLEVFLETHSETEILDNLNLPFDLIGINNRNLNSFEVAVENSIKLAELLPKSCVKIAESGIQDFETVQLLKKYGFNGFLIGEYFMREQNPAAKCAELIQKLKR